MKKIKLNNLEYELIEDFNGFDEEEVVKKATDYFIPYDYIMGDWAYGKLRLKGFCNKNNKIYNPINDFNKKEVYLKDSCAYGCRYFVLKKLS